MMKQKGTLYMPYSEFIDWGLQGDHAIRDRELYAFNIAFKKYLKVKDLDVLKILNLKCVFVYYTLKIYETY